MTDVLRLIKKYPNRRLYDTKTSSYITLADVKELVLKQEAFQVVDAKSGEDLTRAILLQIILEEESGGVPMFSADVLSQLIRFYGNAMQGMMGSYLEKNVEAFTEIQKRIHDQSKVLYGDPSKVNEQLWAQFMNFQGPAMNSVMSAYMDQSKNVFVKMQEQLENQTKTMFSGFQFPGFPQGKPAGEEGSGKKDKS
ncbi:MAG: polyhydroxyalkanoate synthesis repressor PhaR [Proteobacteria bacterium]|nr:polyhydroxyalkanoate synthesis repressor PhaR [Pseudomonadota bacterium]